MTEVYTIDLYDMDSIKMNWDSLTRHVSPEKLERLRGIRVFKDAARVLAADLLVRVLVCQHTGKYNGDIKFGLSRYGKPFLLNGSGELRFNVSHSGRWVAVSFGACENGVDIQEIRNVRGQTDPEDFITQWVIREARLKCRGEGMLGRPDESLFCKSYSPDATTRAAVCAVEDGFSELKNISMEEFLAKCEGLYS